MRTIKLMPDYQCFPLWEASPGSYGNVNPADLPISPSLQSRLAKWAKSFDETLNSIDPLKSGFKSSYDEIKFRKDGEILLKDLRSELKDTCLVIDKI